MKVLGVSGSPIPNSNTDRAVKAVLAEKAKTADALVVGGYTPYSSLDAPTKAFQEGNSMKTSADDARRNQLYALLGDLPDRKRRIAATTVTTEC